MYSAYINLQNEQLKLTFIGQMGACVLLNVTLHGRKGKRCPAQLQEWYLKMKRTVAASSDTEIRRPDDVN